MGTLAISQPVRQATIEAVIILANGKRENLGVISYYSSNPFKRFAWRALAWIRGV